MSKLNELLHRAENLKSEATGQSTTTNNVAPFGNKSAFDYMITLANRQPLSITEDNIRTLHQLIHPTEKPGITGGYRTEFVKADDTAHTPPPPEDLPRLMGHLSDQILFSRNTLHPIELAAMAHKRLVDIWPFTDGNRQTANLLLNLVLIHHGYPVIIPDENQRDDYCKALSASRKLNDMEPFSILIAEWVIRSFDDEKK